ncbi:MAG: hypothetical protein ACKOUM_12800, partial [Sphingopyxis sp.]
MEWLSPSITGDSAPRALDRVGFDMIRAMVSARQSASVTVRALAASTASALGNGATARGARLADALDILH